MYFRVKFEVRSGYGGPFLSIPVSKRIQGRWRLAGRLTECCFNFSKIAEKKAKNTRIRVFSSRPEYKGKREGEYCFISAENALF